VLELTIRFVRILDWCRSERQRQRDICVLCYFYELVVRANVRGRAARVRGATRPVNGRLHSVYCMSCTSCSCFAVQTSPV
jgi:hypothetical protein